MNTQRTMGSHYLPKTYLKHFKKDEKLLMYMKGERFFKSGLRENDRMKEINGIKGLNKIAKENNLYLAEIPNLNPNAIENLFREISEDEFDQLIEKINNLSVGEEIPGYIKEKICLQMASFRVRTPFFKWEIETLHSGILKHLTKLHLSCTSPGNLVKEYKEKTGKTIKIGDIKKILEYIKNNKLEITWSNLLFIQYALEMIELYTKIFLDMNMIICKTREDRFLITSDNPVVHFVPVEKTHIFYNNPRSLASPDTQVFFSLTKHHFIHLSRRDRKESFYEVNRQLSYIQNFNIAKQSWNFIFSPIRMNELQKYINDYLPFPFILKVS